MQAEIKGINIENLSKKDGFLSLFAFQTIISIRIYLRFFSYVKNGGSNNGGLVLRLGFIKMTKRTAWLWFLVLWFLRHKGLSWLEYRLIWEDVSDSLIYEFISVISIFFKSLYIEVVNFDSLQKFVIRTQYNEIQ